MKTILIVYFPFLVIKIILIEENYLTVKEDYVKLLWIKIEHSFNITDDEIETFHEEARLNV